MKYLCNHLFLLYLCTLLNEKNMLKKGMRLIVLLGLVLLGDQATAQQDSQYTQYMYNTMMINPAYAGSRDCTSIFALYRNQWVGLDGAPKTASLSFHTPFEEKHIGIGAGIYRSWSFLLWRKILCRFLYPLSLGYQNILQDR